MKVRYVHADPAYGDHDAYGPLRATVLGRVFSYVPALVAGSIVTPKRRLVSTALLALGLTQVPWYQNFHRVLNRATWSPLAASRILLGLLVTTFVRQGPLVGPVL